MKLPSKEVQDTYLENQREALLNQKFMKEFELTFNKTWLNFVGKSQRKDIRAKIAKLEVELEGLDEYLLIINRHLPDELTELEDGKKKSLMESKIDEIKKGNFRGVIAKELSEYRHELSKDIEIQEAEEEQLEDYEEALRENEIIYEVCKGFIQKLK
jgi:hypothetical protein